MSQQQTQEFKETIVQLHKSDQSVAELVKEYGIAKLVIYKWIQLFSQSENSHSANISLHEFRQIRKKMAKMREENEI